MIVKRNFTSELCSYVHNGVRYNDFLSQNVSGNDILSFINNNVKKIFIFAYENPQYLLPQIEILFFFFYYRQ